MASAMPVKRHEPPSPRPLGYLTRPLDVIGDELGKRVEMGSALLRDLENPTGQLDKLKEDIRRWRTYNSTWLARVFTTREVADRYGYVGLQFVAAYGPTDYWREVADLRERVKTDTDWLEGLAEELPLYVRSASDHEDGSKEDRTVGARNARVNIQNYGTIGQLNSAETLRNIDHHISAVGNQELAQGLEALKQAIRDDPSLNDPGRQELLDNVDDLAEAAGAAPHDRKRGRITAAIAAITAGAEGLTKVKEVADSWLPVLSQHLLSR